MQESQDLFCPVLTSLPEVRPKQGYDCLHMLELTRFPNVVRLPLLMRRAMNAIHMPDSPYRAMESTDDIFIGHLDLSFAVLSSIALVERSSEASFTLEQPGRPLYVFHCILSARSTDRGASLRVV